MPVSEPGITDDWNAGTEAAEADVTEQRTPVLPEEAEQATHVPASSRPPLADVDEADQLDQEREVPWDDDRD
jgi:hypothetical protein